MIVRILCGLIFSALLYLPAYAQQPAIDTVRYPDGSIKEVFQVLKGGHVKNGSYRYFYPGGVLGQEAVFANDTLHGDFAMYYPEGGIKMRCSFHKGLRHGLMSLFDNDGLLLETLTFRYGGISGENVRYYSTGERNIIANRIGDYWQGEVIILYKSGNLQARVAYVDGRKNGLMTTYFEDGTVMNESRYQNDVRGGCYYANYSNGNLAERGQYVDGKRAGHWTSYHPDGHTIYTEGDYQDGNYTGLWHIYNADGTLHHTATFQQGMEMGAVQYRDGQKTLYFMGSPIIPERD